MSCGNCEKKHSDRDLRMALFLFLAMECKTSDSAFRRAWRVAFAGGMVDSLEPPSNYTLTGDW